MMTFETGGHLLDDRDRVDASTARWCASGRASSSGSARTTSMCWGVPLVAALVLLFTNSLGGADAGGHETWCWIRSADRGDAAGYVQVAVFYLPLIAAFGFNALVYLRVGRAFRALVDEGAVDAGKERMVQLRLRLHLLAFLAVWLAPLVERTWQLGSTPPRCRRRCASPRRSPAARSGC